MAAEVMLFDPEFEALLREAAADPRSSLLRVKRPQVLKGLYERESPVGPMTAGLTAVEREIVRVHRCEVARLLREACKVKLIEGPTSKHFVNPYSTAEDRLQVPEKDDWVRSVHDAEIHRGGKEDLDREFDLLGLCVANRLGATPSPVQLAAASYRLQPTNEARILAAMDLAQTSGPRTALRTLQEVLRNQPSMSEVGSAWDNIGFSWERAGDQQRAHDSFEEGCRAIPERASTQLNRLILALQVGNKPSAEDAARRLDDLVSSDQPWVNWFVDSAVVRRQGGEWTPTPVGRKLALALESQMGAVGRRIAHVLT